VCEATTSPDPLDDEQSLAGEHEKVFLIGFPVVHRHWLTRPEHSETDSELREVRLTLDARRSPSPPEVPPAGLTGVQDEPSLPGGQARPRSV